MSAKGSRRDQFAVREPTPAGLLGGGGGAGELVGPEHERDGRQGGGHAGGLCERHGIAEAELLGHRVGGSFLARRVHDLGGGHGHALIGVGRADHVPAGGGERALGLARGTGAAVAVDHRELDLTVGDRRAAPGVLASSR